MELFNKKERGIKTVKDLRTNDPIGIQPKAIAGEHVSVK